MNVKHERGAAAVEFALVALPLMLILVAIVSLGIVFNQQLAVTAAAREAVRHYAVNHSTSATARADAEGIAAGLVDGAVTFSWTLCSSTTPGGDAEVLVRTTVTPPIGGFEELVGLNNLQLTGVGTMRCGG